MTNQEAQNILLKQFDKISGSYSYQNAEKIDLEEALLKGAEALGKQIPQKRKGSKNGRNKRGSKK